MSLVSAFASSSSAHNVPTLEALYDATNISQLLQVPTEDRQTLDRYAEHLTRVFHLQTSITWLQLAQILNTEFIAPCLSEEVHELPRTQKPLIFMNGIVTANVVSRGELQAAQEFFWTNVDFLSSCPVPSSNDLALVVSHLYTRSDFGALRCTWWEKQKLHVLLELSVHRDSTLRSPLTWQRSPPNMWKLVLSPTFPHPLTLQVLDLYNAPQAIQVQGCVLPGNGFYHPDHTAPGIETTHYSCLPHPENDCKHGVVYVAEPHNHWVLEVRRANGFIYRWTHPTAPAHQLWAGTWHFVMAWSEVEVDPDRVLDHEALISPCAIRLVPFQAFYQAKWEAKAWLRSYLTSDDNEEATIYNKGKVMQLLRRCLAEYVPLDAPLLPHGPLNGNPWISLEGLKVLFAEILPPKRALFLRPQGYTFALSETAIIDIGDKLFHLIDNISPGYRKNASTLTDYCVQHLSHVFPIRNIEHVNLLKHAPHLPSHVANIYDLYTLLRDSRVVARFADPDGITPLCWSPQAGGPQVRISSNPEYMNKHQRQQVETFLSSVLEQIGINHRVSTTSLAAFCTRHFGSRASPTLSSLLPRPTFRVQVLFDNEKRLEWVLRCFLVALPKDLEPLQAFAWEEEDDQRGAYIVPNRHHVTLSHQSILFLGRLLAQESCQNGQDRWPNMAALLTEEGIAWSFCRAKLPEAMPKAYEKFLTRWLVTDSPQQTPERPLWLDTQGSQELLRLNPYFSNEALPESPEVGEFRVLLAATALHQIPRDQRRDVGLLLQVCGSSKMRQGWHASHFNAMRIQTLIRDHLIASSHTGDERHPLVWSQGVLVSNHLPKRVIQIVQQEAWRLFPQAPPNARETISNFATFYLHHRGHLDDIEVPVLESILYDHLVVFSAAHLPCFPLRHIGKTLVTNPYFDFL